MSRRGSHRENENATHEGPEPSGRVSEGSDLKAWRPKHVWIVAAMATYMCGHLLFVGDPLIVLALVAIGIVGGLMIVFGDHPLGFLGWLKSCFRRDL